jgi:mannose-6-phosphate isomerase-like protein (cupin superfamily)
VLELPSRTVVPLLHPSLHGLPFGMALELRSPAAPPPPLEQKDRSMLELHFVLDGQGSLRLEDGSQQPLQAGDTVLMTLGAGACCAAPAHPAAAPAARGLASLVVYIPRALLDAPPEARASASNAEVAALVARAWGPLGAATPQAALQQREADAVLRGARDLASQVASSRMNPPGGAAPPPGGWQAAVGRALSAAAAAAAALALRDGDAPVRRALQDLTAFRLPNQTNRLALVFDPLTHQQNPNLVFGIEMFEPGHRTTPHVHASAHEVFFVLAGQGEGFCDGRRFPLAAGDVAAFRPGSTHGIDNGGAGRMYCLELMLPDEAFAAMVRAGQPSGGLADDDLCVMARVGCS